VTSYEEEEEEEPGFEGEFFAVRFRRENRFSP